MRKKNLRTKTMDWGQTFSMSDVGTFFSGFCSRSSSEGRLRNFVERKLLENREREEQKLRGFNSTPI